MRPLLSVGLDYSWSLDFVRSLFVTIHGAKYVFVMAEHFSKWTKLVTLLQNSSKLATMAFLHPPLVHVGAPDECWQIKGGNFSVLLKIYALKPWYIIAPPLGITLRWRARLSGLFRQSSMLYRSMVYRSMVFFLETTKIETWCCDGLLWAIILASKHL